MIKLSVFLIVLISILSVGKSEIIALVYLFTTEEVYDYSRKEFVRRSIF